MIITVGGDKSYSLGSEFRAIRKVQDEKLATPTARPCPGPPCLWAGRPPSQLPAASDWPPR
eukprot:398792-Alexandrium_andersonii.AAC.1